MELNQENQVREEELIALLATAEVAAVDVGLRER